MLRKTIYIGVLCFFIGIVFSYNIIAEYSDIEILTISNNSERLLVGPDLVPTEFSIVQIGDWDPIDESIPIGIYYNFCNYGDGVVPVGTSSANVIYFSNGWSAGTGFVIYSDMVPGDCMVKNPTGHKIKLISSEDIGIQIQATLLIDHPNYVNESNENNNEIICFITPYSNQFPVADFNYNPHNPSTSDIIQFIDVSTPVSGTIQYWTWNFGDGNSSNITNPTHQYSDNGIFLVTLTVENSLQFVDTTSKYIVVTNEPPTAYIDVIEPNPAINNRNISFVGHGEDLDGKITSHVWNSDIDGLIGTDASFEIKDLSLGMHNITLKVQDDDGDWSEPVNETLIVTENLPPEKPTIIGPISGKPGVEYEYTILSTDSEGDEVSYYVDWGDGNTGGWTRMLPSGEEYNVYHTWEEEGNYIIKVKAKDDYSAESDWGTLEVSMPKSKNSYYQNNISIEFRGGFGLTIIIKNNGNSTIPILEFIFCLDAPWMILGGESTTTLSNIAPGSEERIITGFLFGFGRFDATVNVLDISESRSGFMIGPFVILF